MNGFREAKDMSTEELKVSHLLLCALMHGIDSVADFNTKTRIMESAYSICDDQDSWESLKQN